MLDPAGGRFSVLSSSAAIIFSTVDGSASVAEIAASIAEETGLTEADLMTDVQGALASMQAEGLITFEDTGADSPLRASSTSTAPPGTGGSPAPADPPDAPSGVVRIGPLQVGAASTVVLVSAPELVERLEGLLCILPPSPPGKVADARLAVARSPDGRYDVRLDDVSVATADTAAVAVDAVLAACNRIASTRSVGAVRLHGGAVARDGRAVAICGTSGSAKSTLVAALVQLGWQYLTDEVVIVDAPTLGVTAYPKWIDLAPDAVQRLGLEPAAAVGPSGRKLHLPPASLGPVGDSAQLAAIVLLGQGDVPTDDRFERLPVADAVEALLGHVFAETFDRDDGLARLVDVCVGVPVGALGRDRLDVMAAAVDGWLA